MRAAAAKISIQRGSDLRIARVSLALEQGHGRNDDAVDAVSALDRLLVDERLLQRVESRFVADPLDGRDLVTGDRPKRRVARGDGIAVQEHIARAALRFPTAEPRPLQLQIVAKDVQQRRGRLGLDLAVPTVDSKLESFSHRLLVFLRSRNEDCSALPRRLSSTWSMMYFRAD